MNNAIATRETDEARQETAELNEDRCPLAENGICCIPAEVRDCSLCHNEPDEGEMGEYEDTGYDHGEADLMDGWDGQPDEYTEWQDVYGGDEDPADNIDDMGDW